MGGRVFIERILIFLRLCFGRGVEGFLSHVKEDPNTNEGKLPRHPKDRNELQKQVLAALFSAPEKSEGDRMEVQSIGKGSE